MVAGSRVFNLFAYGGRSQSVNYVVVTPEDTPPETITAAWAYAVRYTAKGLDLPDYERAVEMLSKRHASWIIVQSGLINVQVELAKADDDRPEAGYSDT